MNKYNSQFGAGGTQYAYYHEEDESSFQLVDTSRNLRPMYGRGRFFRGGRGNFRGNNRWNQQQQKNAGQLQVLSKAQKNKERQVLRSVLYPSQHGLICCPKDTNFDGLGRQ